MGVQDFTLFLRRRRYWNNGSISGEVGVAWTASGTSVRVAWPFMGLIIFIVDKSASSDGRKENPIRHV